MQKIHLYFTRSFSANYHFIHSVREYFIKRNIETKIVVSHPDKDSPTLLAADNALIEPSFNAEENELFYQQICIDYTIDYVIPGESSILTLIKPESFIHDSQTKVLTSQSFDLIHTLKSKTETYKLFASKSINNLHIPQFQLVNDINSFEEVYKEIKENNSNVCFKPDVSQGGAGFRIIDNNVNPKETILGYVTVRNSYEYYLEKLKQLKFFPPLIVLEYLSGIEYSIDCFGYGRKLLFCGIREKTNKKRRLIKNDLLKKIAEDIQATFQFSNLYNVQIREEKGKYYLLEINPRYSAGSYIYELEGYHLLGKALDLTLNNVKIQPIEIEPAIIQSLESYCKIPLI
jgi:carbamoylphosphate synthase large subunit